MRLPLCQRLWIKHALLPCGAHLGAAAAHGVCNAAAYCCICNWHMGQHGPATSTAACRCQEGNHAPQVLVGGKHLRVIQDVQALPTFLPGARV
jgi:hypothetical protein